MITTEFYEGQGLGNQLWLYAVVRAIEKIMRFLLGFNQNRDLSREISPI